MRLGTPAWQLDVVVVMAVALDDCAAATETALLLGDVICSVVACITVSGGGNVPHAATAKATASDAIKIRMARIASTALSLANGLLSLRADYTQDCQKTCLYYIINYTNLQLSPDMTMAPFSDALRQKRTRPILSTLNGGK